MTRRFDSDPYAPSCGLRWPTCHVMICDMAQQPRRVVEARAVRVATLLTERERAAVEQAARADGETVSTWLRGAATMRLAMREPKDGTQ